MMLYKNESRMELRIECVSRRQYKGIKWPFKLYKINRKADVEYDDKGMVIQLKCHDKATYDQVFEGMTIQQEQARRKGLVVPKVIINDMD